mmetsp:Transcript_15410/g.33173  ORF Transcript_15410/g.33173 Transcript_15410/m.33173 type:complete len:301 (+) Transcript_15410:214-1116(+)
MRLQICLWRHPHAHRLFCLHLVVIEQHAVLLRLHILHLNLLIPHAHNLIQHFSCRFFLDLAHHDVSLASNSKQTLGLILHRGLKVTLRAHQLCFSNKLLPLLPDSEHSRRPKGRARKLIRLLEFAQLDPDRACEPNLDRVAPKLGLRFHMRRHPKPERVIVHVQRRDWRVMRHLLRQQQRHAMLRRVLVLKRRTKHFSQHGIVRLLPEPLLWKARQLIPKHLQKPLLWCCSANNVHDHFTSLHRLGAFLQRRHRVQHRCRKVYICDVCSVLRASQKLLCHPHHGNPVIRRVLSIINLARL